ncbi:hypothetical protein DBR47_14310 [Paucibacter sp. KBW04]|uniref:hypothetical protein n=1 Tax=Paucibacter sp. KBW04 TaxID=2153361 RepID=UPI000F5881C6|nr:hypothetical protein [Paucibacter sp. KBW04]RQO57963.1 hypothetical protein DBR47_14310 [Paucibacter sp. KBW04]
MSDIDPVKFGALIAQVENLEDQVTSLQNDVKTLLELANKSKGGLWAGMAIASGLGAFANYVISHIKFN